jgi:hypothetical protein
VANSISCSSLWLKADEFVLYTRYGVKAGELLRLTDRRMSQPLGGLSDEQLTVVGSEAGSPLVKMVRPEECSGRNLLPFPA